jgi:hypothetical protein
MVLAAGAVALVPYGDVMVTIIEDLVHHMDARLELVEEDLQDPMARGQTLVAAVADTTRLRRRFVKHYYVSGVTQSTRDRLCVVVQTPHPRR